MRLILAAIPQSIRDWAVWLLAALILFSEFGIEPLDRYILSRLPWYKEEDPEVAARGIRMVTHVGEFALACCCPAIRSPFLKSEYVTRVSRRPLVMRPGPRPWQAPWR